MGIFDKYFPKKGLNELTYKPKSEQEAWMGIMMACAASDGMLSEVEENYIFEYLVRKTFFDICKPADNTIRNYWHPVKDAHSEFGSKMLIDVCVQFISEENKSVLFTLVFDVLLSDGILSDDEKEISEYLIDKLNIDEELAHRIIEVLLIKNTYSVKIFN